MAILENSQAIDPCRAGSSFGFIGATSRATRVFLLKIIGSSMRHGGTDYVLGDGVVNGGLLTNPLTRKLEIFAPLSSEDRRFLADLAGHGRRVDARTDIIREGERPDDVRLVLEGFACRYKILPDGKRHIMAYLVLGDLCDVHVFILKKMDHSIGTLSACRAVDIPRPRIL
jgi:hypothetical protein